MKKLLALLPLMLLSSCDNLVIDKGMSALAANDTTVVMKVEGCGYQYAPGYAYCKLREGDNAGINLFLVAPSSFCDADECAFYKIYSPSGQLVSGGAFPKDKYSIGVPWSKILGRSTFAKNDLGYWGVVLEVHYKDSDGHDIMAVSEGEIRLRIYDKDYHDLSHVDSDPNFTWEYHLDKQIIKMTTGMRAYVSPRN